MTEIAGLIIREPYHSGILLLHRNTPDLIQWEVPGGKVKPGEKPLQAALREGEEELGVKAKVIRYLRSVPFVQNAEEYMAHWYFARLAEQPRIEESNLFDDLAYINLGIYGIGAKGLSPNAENLVRAIQNDELDLSH
jgi:ADP-ribose pyrophosphatase YjhB (NUDIX family)